MKINLLVIKLVSALTLLIASNALATCMSGDCKNGFGTFKADSGATITTMFENRRPTGYYVMDLRGSGTSSVCEGVAVRGQYTGPRRCQYNDTPFFDQFLDGNRGVLILKPGIIHEEGIFKGMKLTFETPVNVDSIFQSLRDARSRADYRVVDVLPEELWFLPTSRDNLMSEYLAKYYPKKDKELPTLSDDSAPIASAVGENAPYCIEGDCDNGFGILDKLNNKVVARFLNSQAFGYGLWFNPNGSVCETYFIKGVATGVQRCTIEAKEVLDGIAYIELVDGKKSHSFVTDKKGKIFTRLVLSGGDMKREDIDVQSMWEQAKRNRDAASDFVLRQLPSELEAFPEVWFPNERQDQAKKNEKTANGSGCISGNCRDGVGRYEWKDGNFTIANYVDGKREGYAVYSSKSGDTECERIYRKNTVNGLSVCKTVYKGKARAHFSYMVDGERDKEDLLLIADIEGKVTTYSPVSKNPDEDYERLKRDYEAIRSASKPGFRDELSEEFRGIGLPSKASFDSHLKAKSTKTEDKSDATCEFGDCKNGFGSYRFKSGDQHVGYFKNSRQHGYGILVQERRPGRKRVCETRYQDGRRTGLRVCLNHGTDVATAYYYSNGGKANGRGISWNASSREIVKLGLWRNNKFIREEPADLRQIASDWQSIKDSPQAVMRASFLTDEFLALELPSQDDQSEWLRQKELERTKTTQVIPEEAPFKLGCISGDCENGFGEFATRESTLTGNFRNGKISGYALITKSESQCEALMRNGAHAGVEHCVDINTGNHTFSEKNSSGLQAASIIISESGKLIDYKVYEDDKPMNLSFTSSKDKDRLAMLDFEYLAQQLDDLKKSSTPDFQSRKVSTLESIPELVASNKATADKKSASRPSSQPIVNRGVEVEPPVAPSPKSNLQRLAHIVAELNAGSRQINFNYRLDRVRIDPKKFELVYEFTAMKPIRDLDTSVISIANQTAYCSSSKLKPFRDENMPARWSYVDAEDETFEVLTRIKECR